MKNPVKMLKKMSWSHEWRGVVKTNPFSMQIWAGKRELFRNRLVIVIDVLFQEVRKILFPEKRQGKGALAYGDREFSFDNSPVIHVKMHRTSCFNMPNIMPTCINPHLDFDDDHEEDDQQSHHNMHTQSFFICNNNVEEEEKEEIKEVCEEDEEIDEKAGIFIAKFYKEMRLQRNT